MDGLHLRHAREDDARQIAVVHVDSWRSAYRGLIDQQVLDGLSVDQRETSWRGWIQRSRVRLPTDDGASDPHRIIVAELDGRIVGWSSFGRGRDAGTSDAGELAGLYVHPDFWGMRVGHALLARTELELRNDGHRDGYLWVLYGNERASSFYERHGWHADGAEKVDDAGGAQGLRELRHTRTLD